MSYQISAANRRSTFWVRHLQPPPAEGSRYSLFPTSPCIFYIAGRCSNKASAMSALHCPKRKTQSDRRTHTQIQMHANTRTHARTHTRTHTHTHTHTQSRVPGRVTHPELEQEEGVVWPFAKQLLQAPLLLGEFVVNLTDVHRLQQGIVVGVIRLPDVYKEMLVVLEEERKPL